jgi:ribosome-associated protein
VNYNSLPQGVRLAVEAAQNKKAAGISVLDLSGVGAFTSYFVICTGFSTPQVQAICNEVEEQLYKELGRSLQHREGRGSSEWALLDFGSFIVHVFSEQARAYYDLERLWRSAPKLTIEDEPDGPGGHRTSNGTAHGNSRNVAMGGSHTSGEAVSK